VAAEAPALHGEGLVPDENPDAAPAPEPVVAPMARVPLPPLDAPTLLEPELMTALVPELVPLPVADTESPVRLPHPAMASDMNASGDHRL
jgi:hypothetical protein